MIDADAIKIFGTNVFIDESVNVGHAVDFYIASEVIEFVKDAQGDKITINTNGKNGKDGKNADHRKNASRKGEDGEDGLPGMNGDNGENGGNLFLIANKCLRSKSEIQLLMTSGGEGGKGGNGGNGGNGADGENGKDASETEHIGFFKLGYCLKKGKPGCRGGDGGIGGNAGLGGYGGFAGEISIEEQGNNIIDTFQSLIESKNKVNSCGQDGLPGFGGKGGKGGEHGLDVLWHKRKFKNLKYSRTSLIRTFWESKN